MTPTTPAIGPSTARPRLAQASRRKRSSRNVLAGSGRDLSPAQRALVQDDDVPAGLPGAHAEITGMDAAGKAGLTPGQMAVTPSHLSRLSGSDRGVARHPRQLYKAGSEVQRYRIRR